MPLRIRIIELMKAKGYATAYQLAKAAEAAKLPLQQRTVYRLVEADGAVENFNAATLEALAELFDVQVADLFELTKGGKR